MTDDTPTQLKVGMWLRDNDPRNTARNRTMSIARFVVGSAVLRDSAGNTARVSLSRIHLDGKPRKSGWSIVR